MFNLGIIGTCFFLVFSILALLVPFFILRIRNEIIKSNEKIEKGLKILGYIADDRAGKEKKKIFTAVDPEISIIDPLPEDEFECDDCFKRVKKSEIETMFCPECHGRLCS